MISQLITKGISAARSQDDARVAHYGADGLRLKLLIWPLANGRLDEFGLANY